MMCNVNSIVNALTLLLLKWKPVVGIFAEALVPFICLFGAAVSSHSTAFPCFIVTVSWLCACTGHVASLWVRCSPLFFH